MGGFTVDTEVLAGFGEQFHSIADDLQAAAAHRSEVLDSQLGGATIGRALRDFDEHWQHGTGRLQHRLRSLGDLVARAATEYAASDRAVADGARPDGAGGSS